MGGAGGLHCCELAEALGMNSILLPLHPGVMAAEGLLLASTEQEAVASLSLLTEEADPQALRSTLHTLFNKCASVLEKEGASRDRLESNLFADACINGQSFTLTIPFSLDGEDPMASFRDRFLEEHERVNGHNPDASVRLVGIRLVLRNPASKHLPRTQATASEDVGRELQCNDIREIIDPSGKACSATIFDRAELRVGQVVTGPAIIEQADTTTLIKEGWLAHVLLTGDIRINLV